MKKATYANSSGFSTYTSGIFAAMSTPPQGYKSITGLVDEAAPTPSGQVPGLQPGQHPGQLKPQEIKCSVCGSLVTGQKYVLNAQPACARCAVAAGAPVDSSAAFSTAVVYGIGAAIAGLAFYAGFTIAFHFYIGYVALAVGWLIGKAMMAGSKGIGGRKYQIVAALLTYFAISLASVPILLAEAYEKGTEIDWANFAGVLVVYGIASPILDLAGGMAFGLIGLLILFVGLRIAWRLTAAKKVIVAKPAGSY
jgi:hypothetical protein